MKKKPFTTRNIAKYCDVTIHAVNKWINAGKLNAYRTPGNHKKILEKDFIEFLQRNNMLIPDELQGLLNKKRVLVVDDEKTTVRLIEGLLNREGSYEIESAYNGFEAGLKFNTFKPRLITLDLSMPEMNGFEVCSHIRSDPKNENIRILVVSAYLDSDNIKKILDLGADDYLSKPFKSQDLKNKVINLLNEEVNPVP